MLDFPNTPWSAIVAAQDSAHPAFQRNIERLCQIYWGPIHSFFLIARRCTRQDAMDMTQGFFVHLLEGRTLLRRADAEKGRFRAYLKTALRNYDRDLAAGRRTLKRGGDRAILSLQGLEQDDHFEICDPDATDPTVEFDRQWTRLLVHRALPVLRAQAKELDYQVFCAYHFPDPGADRLTYKHLAGQFDVSLFAVTHALERARAQFRKALMTLIRESVADEHSAQLEYQELFETDLAS